MSKFNLEIEDFSLLSRKYPDLYVCCLCGTGHKTKDCRIYKLDFTTHNILVCEDCLRGLSNKINSFLSSKPIEKELNVDDNYVDLNLPSGKLWKVTPEKGFYSFKEAEKNFGSSLPTKENFIELVKNTSHRWDKDRLGMIFTGRNGNSLFLPAAGHMDADFSVYNVGVNGNYWSSTPHYSSFNSTNSYELSFTKVCINPAGISSLSGSRSVVLVK